MTETDPEKRLIGFACISTYGQMLDTQLSRAHLRRRRRSGIGRLTDQTAAAQLWLRAGSSCPTTAIAGAIGERRNRGGKRSSSRARRLRQERTSRPDRLKDGPPAVPLDVKALTKKLYAIKSLAALGLGRRGVVR